MPVPRKSEQQDERSDDQDAARFKFENVGLWTALRGWRIRRWAGSRHQSIVAPRA